jgi:ABC-2 type transport system permease protein
VTTYHPLRELILARAREFFREPEAIFWVYVFPVLLAVGLGVAFRTKAPEPLRVAVEREAAATAESASLSPEKVAARLGESPRFKVEVKAPGEAEADLGHGRVDLAVVLEAGDRYRFIFDPSRNESVLGKELVRAALEPDECRKGLNSVDQAVTAPGSRYIDFLIPGLIGMNIMGGGLWGIGFVIVDLRVRKLLKRFLATPMRKSDFLLSIIGSRMLFLVPEILLLLVLGCLFFGVPLGSPSAVTVISLASALCFSGMGLLLATRARKIEAISGLMNLVMLPMWIFSGIFFSSERFPDVVQPLIRALPLTASINALRAVMLEGRPLVSQAGELAILAAWGIVSFVLSLKFFRWL